MKIILMRHYKVAFDYKKKYTSQEFDAASIGYNCSDVYDQEGSKLITEVLYASDMHRAQMTARLAFNREPQILDNVYEVTMKSYKFSERPKSIWWWELMARVHWRLNLKTQYQTKNQTIKRLNQAINELELRGEDATVVMHGMAMRHMSRLLKRRGYDGEIAYRAKNGECYTYIKA